MLQIDPLPLFRLLHSAVKANQPIAVTLENRRWYVGYITEFPNLDPLEQCFSLIPVLSGYRESESLRVKGPTFYDPVYEKIDKNKFAVTIPLDSVRVANFFDQAVYAKFFSETKDDEEEAKLTRSWEPLRVKPVTRSASDRPARSRAL